MLEDAAIKAVVNYLGTQGPLGIAVLVLAAIVVYLWRDNRALQKSCDEKLAAQEARHENVIAAERKLNAELYEARLEDLKKVVETAKDLTNTFDVVFARGRLA